MFFSYYITENDICKIYNSLTSIACSYIMILGDVMNLIQLKYFSAVCETGTVSEASEILHISQPSLSNAIKEMETEFGVKLFFRQHRGMSMTSEGERLYKMAKELLNRAEQTENIMKDMGKQRKILRLGVPPMIGSVILPKIYREFLSENSDIHIEITEGGQHELCEKLSEGLLDMIFMPHENFEEKDFSGINIVNTEIVCCVSESNLLAQKECVTADELERIPVVLFKDSFYHTKEARKWFASANVNPDIILQTAQLSTIRSLILNNVAVGFMFRTLVDEEEGIKAVSASPKMEINISLVWKKDSYFFTAMKKFREYVVSSDLF